MSLHVVVADLEMATQAVIGGASVLRLAPGAGADGLLAAGLGLRRLGTPFYVLDDVEAALELGADGVHLGAHAERAERARRAGLRVGVSIASLAVALDGAADYLELASANGGDGAAAFIDELAAICAAARVPVIVGGDPDATSAAAYVAAGAAGIAVVGAPHDRTLREALDAALAARSAAPASRPTSGGEAQR